MLTRAEIGPLFKRACAGEEVYQVVPLALKLWQSKDSPSANHLAFSLFLTDNLILLYFVVLSFSFLSRAECPPKLKW